MMQIAVDAITFFATCDERSVDPDVAIDQLERISVALRQLSRNDQRAFLEFVERAAVEASDHGDSISAEFLEALPENLGLRRSRVGGPT